MQLLIDSTQETPASLRFIAATLCALADTYGPPLELEPAPSINGPQTPVVLHAHAPAAPIDPEPHFLDRLFTDPAQMDPAAVFGRSVPAGTTVDPTLPASSAVAPVPAVVPTAPPAPLVTVATPASAADVAVIGTVPAAAATPGVNTVDSDGLPWDARVHSETRKTNADGTWRYRRNLDPQVKENVTALLKAQYGSQLPASPQLPLAPPPPGATGTQHVPAEAPPAPSTVILQPGVGLPQPSATVPLSPGIPVGMPNTPQSPVVPALGFRDFMSAVNKSLAAGRLTQDQLTNACKAVNLDGISALASEPGKISLVHSQIAHLLGAATA